MAKIKEVTVRINVEDGDVKTTTKNFNELNTTVTKGSKQMTGSLNTMSKSLVKVGAALGGALNSLIVLVLWLLRPLLQGLSNQ